MKDDGGGKVTLLQHVRALLEQFKTFIVDLMGERDRRYMDRFTAIEGTVVEMKVMINEKFDKANEFRGTLSDQAKTFATASDVDTQMLNVNRRIDEIVSSRLSMKAGDDTFATIRSYIFPAVMALIALWALFGKHP